LLVELASAVGGALAVEEQIDQKDLILNIDVIQ
jgi:hypothetical protein